MTATSIPGAGPSGVLRMTWVRDQLAHVLDHCETDEPSGTWTGLACPDHGLPLGADVDTTTLQRLSARGGELADLIWEAPADLAAGHGQLFQAAIHAYNAGNSGRAQQLWEQGPGHLVPSLGGEPRGARARPARGPDQVLAGQAAALGRGLLRAPLRPARPPAAARPQHRSY